MRNSKPQSPLSGTAPTVSGDAERFFAVALDLLCIADKDGHFLKLNPEWEFTLGYALEELEGMRLLNYVHPDDVALTKEAMERLGADEQRLHFINRFRHKEGEYRYLEWRAQLEADLIYAAARDVTDHKLAEAGLQQQTAFLSGLLDSIPDLVFFKNTEGMYLGANREFAQLVGTDLKAVIGQTDYDLFEKGQADLFRENDLIAVGQEGVYYNEEWVVYPGGRAVLVDTKKTRLRDTAGNVIGLVGISRDITERRRIQEQLEVSQSNFVAFFNLSLDFLMVLDETGNILVANDTVVDRLGYSDDELVGMSVLSLHPPEYREEAARIVQGMLEGHLDVCPLPLQTRVGDNIPVETRIVRGVWDGRPALFGISKDMTELAFSEEKFAKAFDHNPALMAISTVEDGRFTNVNEMFLSTLGYSREEVIGRTSEELGVLVEPGQRKEVMCAGEDSGISRHTGVLVRTKTGETRVGEFTAQRIFIQGQPHLLTVMNDLTDKNRVEQDLLRRVMFEQLMVTVSSQLIRAEGSELDQVLGDTLTQVGEFLGVDRTYVFRYSPDLELMDNTHEWCADGIASERDNLQGLPTAIFPAWIATLLKGEVVDIPEVSVLPSSWQAEKDILQAQGIQSVLVLPIVSGGIHYGFMGYDSVRAAVRWGREDRDLLRILADNLGATLERHHQYAEFQIASQRASELATEAETANRAKSEFLANMSHEIRTPMSGILGMARLLQDTPLTDKQQHKVATIRRNGASLLRVINDILDFSKIEAGRMDIERISFSFDEVVRNTFQLFEVAATEKGNDLLSFVDPSIPPLLVSDPVRLAQILNNLVGNAVKFTDKGEIRVFARILARRGNTLDLEISVQDTGIGMTEEAMSRLFVPFSQADTSTTRKYGGTGLGLAITARLCNLMGGEIGVTSVLGEGSEFTVRLPVLASTEGDVDVSPTLDFKGARILVVDDNPILRRHLSGLLAGWSFEVEAVASGEEALTTLRRAEREQNPFAVCLLDWQMPDMDGIETAKRIRRESLLLEPRMLMVTGYHLAEARDLATAAGIKGLLTKPISPATLLVEIRSVLGTAEGSSSAPTGQDPVRFTGVRVLVVEDNDVNREVAVEMLSRMGIDVGLAGDGEEAVQLVRNNDYDIVLMDIQMPGMDGFEATRAIRSLEDRAGVDHLPILALTAHAMRGDRERSLVAGMNDHITKPIEPEELSTVLQRWLPAEKWVARDAVLQPTQMSSEGDCPLPSVVVGLDTELGLRRASGNHELYQSLLGMFIDDCAGTQEELLDELAMGDTTTALRRAHSIKSMAGNIGAAGLQSAAASLEAVLRRQESYDEHLHVFFAHLTAVTEAIRGSMSSQEAGAQVPMDRPAGEEAEFRDLLGRLRVALEDAEPVPCKEILGVLVQKQWPGVDEFHLSELSHMVRRYRFDAALDVLDELSGAIDGRGEVHCHD